MPKVTFKNTDTTVEVDAGANLKDITKANSWPIPYGCEDGVCGTCLVKVVEGAENLSPLTEKEKITISVMGVDDTYRLACQCTVNGDVTIEQ